jgi:hypothetical protein
MQGEPVVAMQRYSNVVMVGIILPAAVIGAGLAGCSRAPAAKDSQAVSAAAQPMRQPRWLESYRDRTAARPQPVAEPPAPEAAPIAPAAPATLAADPKAAPVETSSALSAVELAIPDTPPASAEGKPGRALVRSRDTSTVDAHALLTAGWTDLVPSESAGPKPDDTATAPPEESPEKLGPDASVLQVEETQTADEGSTADPVAVKVEPESPSVEAAASPAAMANQPRPEVATYPDQVPPTLSRPPRLQR